MCDKDQNMTCGSLVGQNEEHWFVISANIKFLESGRGWRAAKAPTGNQTLAGGWGKDAALVHGVHSLPGESLDVFLWQQTPMTYTYVRLYPLTISLQDKLDIPAVFTLFLYTQHLIAVFRANFSIAIDFIALKLQTNCK